MIMIGLVPGLRAQRSVSRPRFQLTSRITATLAILSYAQAQLTEAYVYSWSMDALWDCGEPWPGASTYISTGLGACAHCYDVAVALPLAQRKYDANHGRRSQYSCCYLV